MLSLRKDPRFNDRANVAFFHLCTFALCGLLLLCMQPNPVERVEGSPPWKHDVGGIGLWGMIILSFPFVWFAELAINRGMPSSVQTTFVNTVIFLPLNAYFWGEVALAFSEWRKRRKKPEPAPPEP